MSFLLPPLNSTLLPSLTPHVLHPPIYHTTSPSILSFISDKHLSLFAPIFLYWALSLAFYAIDLAQFPYFERLRIHESPEVLARNKATVLDVVKAVVFQQVVQTALGLCWLESEEDILRREVYMDHLDEMSKLAPVVGRLLVLLLGQRTADNVIQSHGKDVVQWVYWWGIPAVQLLFAL
jgi:sphinganine C4-monooxygenase